MYEEMNCTGNMADDIQMIIDAIKGEMNPGDLIWFHKFGVYGNVDLGIHLDEDHDIRFYVEPWDEEDQIFITDWDGSDYYFVSENPNEMDRLWRDLEQVWKDSGEYILENL